MRSTGSSILFVIALLPGIGTAADFQLTSPTVKNKGAIGKAHVFNGFGCSGDNVSPELRWANAPKGTNAPTGSGWWHWVIFNIPPAITALPADAGKPDGSDVPQGSIQSMTDFGQPGYGGPCPPPGHKPHRYIFTVFALKVDQLLLKPGASGAMVGYYLNQNALAKASFTGLYSRK